jgi:hypothetical protein
MESIPRYEINDIVNFTMSKASVIGQIINSDYTTYDIKLFDNNFILSEFEIWKYRPSEYKNDEWFETLTDGNVRLKIVCVPERKVKFSIKREDIPRFQNAKTNGEKFKYLLRGLWKDLVMRKVKFVKLPEKELGIWKYSINDNGIIRSESLVSGTKIPNDGYFYCKYYSHYFGFTSKFENDNREIYFSLENYNGLDLNIDSTGWFSVWGNHNSGSKPPSPGQFICGLVKEGEKGSYYDKWFTCSTQFFNFWKFIMSNGRTNIDELLKLVVSNECPSVKLTDEEKRIRLNIAQKYRRCFDYCNSVHYDDIIKFITQDTLCKQPKLIYNILGMF